MRFYFLLLFLAFNVLPLHASESVLTDSRENWSTMIGEIHQWLEENSTQDLVKYRENAEARLAIFSRICKDAEKRISELNFLLWSQPDNAILGISISVYNKQILDLNDFFEARLFRITQARTYLGSEIDRYDKLRTMLEQADPQYFTAEQLAGRTGSLKKMAQFITELNQIAKPVDAQINVAEKIREKIAAVMKAGKKRNDEVLKKMLFNPQSDIVNCLIVLKLQLYLWIRDIPLNLSVQIPDGYDFWLKFLALAVIGGTLFALFGRLLYNKLQKFKMIPQNTGKITILKQGWFFLGAGLLMFGTYFWTSVVEYSFFCRLAMIFISISFLLFTLKIRLKPELYKGVFKLYLPLLLLYIFGSILFTLVVTYRPLILIWTVANIPVAIATAYYMIKHKLPVLDRLLGFLTVVITLGCSGMAAYGYAFMAITVTMVWFLAAIGIQAGISLTALATRFKPETTSQRIAASFIFLILIPLKWLLILGGLIYWTALQFNVQNLLETFLESNLFPDVAFVQVSILNVFFSLAAALILFFILSTVKNVIRLLFLEDADSGLLASFLTLGTYLVWGAYAIFVLMVFRVPSTSVQVVLGGMSVGLGFGLRDIIENFICGIILLAGKSVRPGDVIEFDDTWGIVQKISIRSTVIKTFDDAIINLPNSVVVSKNFKNWTLTGHVIRRDIKIGVTYDSDIAAVKRMLLEIAAADNNVLPHPPPKVLCMDLGASKMELCLRLWFKDLRKNTDSESSIREEIERRFKESKVVIA
ncbi:MAG: mechanosensitive ion channel domain-containing protein [Victivallaceae bacterium]|jgi:small-conductance mechanosensitive channel